MNHALEEIIRTIPGTPAEVLHTLGSSAGTSVLAAWEEYLGIDSAQSISPSVTALRSLPLHKHSELFSIAGHIYIRAHRSALRCIQEIIATGSPILPNDKGTDSVIATRILHHYDARLPLTISPISGFSIRQLSLSDADSMGELHGESGVGDTSAALVEVTHPKVIGVWNRGKLVAAASLLDWTPLWDIGVLTHPRFRGRGLGSLAVVALTKLALEMGGVPLYRATIENVGSRRLAAHAGFRPCFIQQDIRTGNQDAPADGGET